MGPGYTGTQTLSNKLTKILYTHIKHNLPDITKEISERIGEVSERLKELGPPMPEEPTEKLQMAWSMVMEFCQCFKNAIAGKAISRKERKEVDCELKICREESSSREALKSRSCTTTCSRSSVRATSRSPRNTTTSL
jgi:hypothetical protein